MGIFKTLTEREKDILLEVAAAVMILDDAGESTTGVILTETQSKDAIIIDNVVVPKNTFDVARSIWRETKSSLSVLPKEFEVIKDINSRILVNQGG